VAGSDDCATFTCCDRQPCYLLEARYVCSIWNIPEGFATLLTAGATLFAGVFVIVGAIIAWRSVQRQIRSAENIEAMRREHEIRAVESSLTAELLVYTTAVIQATSTWNLRAAQPNSFPSKWEVTDWPVFTDPLCYRANIGKIGIIREQWVSAALIGFYANLLELNDQSREAVAGRPTNYVTSQNIANRLQLMAANLAHALDGLNEDRKFNIQPDIKLPILNAPDGQAFMQLPEMPKNIQEVLFALAGEPLNPSASLTASRRS
jgi:hypothetical protein